MKARKERGVASEKSLQDIATTNPRVDVGKVREVQQLMDELRKAGVVPQGYRIRSPYEQRPLEDFLHDNPDDD